MATFEVDRHSLPASWEKSLLFKLTRGEQTVEVEVRRDAALEFAWAPSAGWFASDRMEAFLSDLEEAVDRLYEMSPTKRLTLNWNDLYPERS